ncbi:hypothetical protein D9M71_379490 [compost metagenome]
MQLLRRRIADAETLAGGHQAFAKLCVAGQVQIQAERRLPGFPAPQAKQCEQQARQNPIDQQNANQPCCPGLAGAFDTQCGVAAGTDHLLGGNTETEQGRQGAKRLGYGNKGVGTEDGGFPDEAVAPGCHQCQQNDQGADHRQQPQAVDQYADGPAIELLPLQQQEQGGGQLRGLGVPGEFFT